MVDMDGVLMGAGEGHCDVRLTPQLDADGKLPEEDETCLPDDDDQDEGEDEGYVPNEWDDEDDE